MAVIQDLVRNVRAGTRLALFLPVRRDDLRPILDQAVALLVLTIVLDALYEYMVAAEGRVFNWAAAIFDCVEICVLLFTCYLIVRLQRASDSFISLFVALLCVAPFATLATYVMLELFKGHFHDDVLVGLALALLAWFFVVMTRVVRFIYPVGAWRACALAGIVWIFALPLGLLPEDTTSYWYSPLTSEAAAEPVSGKDKARRPPLDIESIYYAQRRLVRRSLQGVASGRPGVTDLYQVGFAGDASQSVFRREVQSVRKLFDDRFDTAGRSVALINHRDTVERLPLASVRNLNIALRSIGKRMDRDDDMLFLFLTSHGSESHRLSVRFNPLGLNDLSPTALRAILDRAQIKWRIIVISACYSGGFIDALKDENTLIVTAARRDRTSFGCSDDNDFTYFGRAYFDEALRRTLSFTEAFSQARIAVTERETADDFKPSEPQIFIGEAIVPKLSALETRLAKRLVERSEERERGVARR